MNAAEETRRRRAYEALIHNISIGPGWEDASCVPDFSPRCPWVLVTISEDSGHAWASLHHTATEAGRSLAEDVDVHGIRVDEEESRLHFLGVNRPLKPAVVTAVKWEEVE
jgi:hypothetical protein